MAELLIVAAAATGLALVVRYARKRSLAVPLWGWTLTVLAFLYAVFALEVVVRFVREGSGKAAAAAGAVLGFFAVVWAIVLALFVFRRGGKS